MERETERRQAKDEALVQRALHDARVLALLHNPALGEKDVRAFVDRASVPFSLIDEQYRRIAMTNVDLLNYYFDNSTPLDNELGYQRVMERNPAMCLELWIRYAPDQSVPPH